MVVAPLDEAEALLAAVAGRDLGAFRTLYERHAGWLAIRLARRCNDRDLVADAVQDTFVAVWQKPRGFRGDGDVAAWLWGIAIWRLVSRLLTRGGELGSAMASFRPTPVEAAVLGESELELGVALLLCWLRHVSGNLEKSSRYASSRAWLDANVKAVLDAH